MPRPEHARARRDEITKNLREVIRKAKAGESLTDGYGMQVKELHDISRDLDDFVLFSGLWEDHARSAGLNPRTGEPLAGKEPA
jgi:hypothetical protein